MVSGGASRVDGFSATLADRFGSPVEAFDPFKRVSCDFQKFGLDPEDAATTAAVAVGLALRRAGDR
jgi:Tfp pilus assembly PilM family ATPase